jgi:type II secretory ATPase GspE/PulE/Tfp pilus assembly ATPase PilB-like protein
LAQRLVRLLCPNCKRPSELPESVLDAHGIAGAQPYEAVGCVRCANTGYRGRIGIYEVMVMTEEIRAAVLEARSSDQIAAIARAQGLRRLRDDGLRKVVSGETSLAEVGRVTGLL